MSNRLWWFEKKMSPKESGTIADIGVDWLEEYVTVEVDFRVSYMLRILPRVSA